MRNVVVSGLALLVVILVACSGGAGIATLPATNARPAAKSVAKTAYVTIRVRVPKHKRRAHFISPSTKAMKVVFDGPTPTNSTIALVPGSSECTSGKNGTTCSVSVGLQACPSSAKCYTGSVTTYDNVSCTKSACSIPAGAHALSKDQSVAFGVVAGKPNIVRLTLDGIVASVGIVPASTSTLTPGTVGYDISKCVVTPQSVTILPFDVDGNEIVGPGAPTAPTLTSDDAVHLAVATPAPGASPNAFTLVPPSSLVSATIPNAFTVVHLTAGYTPLAGTGSTKPVTSGADITFNGDICGVFTTFPVATPTTRPEEMQAGPDGTVWFVEYGADRVGHITTTGTIHDYPLPSGSDAYGLTFGADGNLWLADYKKNQIIQMSTAGTVLNQYPTTTTGSGPSGIVSGTDNKLWFTECLKSKVANVTTGGTLSTEWGTTTPASNPQKITVGPDHALWFTECAKNNIARVTTAGGTPSEYPVLSPNADPFSIVAGPDGALWFTECGLTVNKIGRITTDGLHVTEYPTKTSGSSPEQITNGPDGALWFAEYVNKVGRITTDGVVTEMTIPTGSGAYGIAKGADGALWISQITGNAIVRLQ